MHCAAGLRARLKKIDCVVSAIENSNVWNLQERYLINAFGLGFIEYVGSIKVKTKVKVNLYLHVLAIACYPWTSGS